MKCKWVGMIFGILIFSLSVASADEVVSPGKGRIWGDQNSADALLKMNHDPEVIKNTGTSSDLPAAIHKSCRDSDGNTYNSDDPDYASCMGHPIKGH